MTDPLDFDIHGNRNTPGCLHCDLYEFIEQWRAQHPEVPFERIISDLATVTGEVIASYLIHMQRTQVVHRNRHTDRVRAMARQSCDELIAAMQAKTVQ